MREIVYSRTAQKTLTRMPRNRARRIRDKVRAYAANPAAQANNVTRLRGEEGLTRLRVGNWRINMRDSTVLSILDVTSRGSAYKE